jgi:uncharacterized membrane protein YphA (DoxX/SURF4 family)
METLWTVADWAARILLSAVFLLSGLGHLTHTQAMAAYAGSKGVPSAKLAVIVTGVMILAGGLMIVVNWLPTVGSFLLVAFLLPVAVVMHDFWTVTDPMQRASERAHFLKDLALAGAALLYAVMLHKAGG